MSDSTQTLSGEITFATAPGVLDQLKTRVGPAALTLDLSAVTYVDTAGLSLLLELARRSKKAGGSLKLQGASAQIQRLLRFFALEPLLQ